VKARLTWKNLQVLDTLNHSPYIDEEFFDKRLAQMFFFIAGIQPKTKVLDDTPKMCPSCGLHRARLKRIDHYLSIFFIPVLRVKKGEPMVVCDLCGPVSSEVTSGIEAAPSTVETGRGATCPACGSLVDADFRFCPYCGQKL